MTAFDGDRARPHDCFERAQAMNRGPRADFEVKQKQMSKEGT